MENLKRARFGFEVASMTMRQWNFKAVSNCALLMLAFLMAPATVQGAVYTFSFQNVSGPVAGTVSGTITLPDGDGTGLQASSIFILSAPAALGYTTPFDVFTVMGQIANAFDVSGGQIQASSSFAAASNANAFTLNYFNLGSVLTRVVASSPGDGVQDTANTTLTYGVPSVPEPSPLAIFGIGALCLAFRARRGRKAAAVS